VTCQAKEFKSGGEVVINLGGGLVKRIPLQFHGYSDGSIEIILPPEIREALRNGEMASKVKQSGLQSILEPDPDTRGWHMEVPADKLWSISPVLEERWRAEALRDIAENG
jgi:hypothetical protein